MMKLLLSSLLLASLCAITSWSVSPMGTVVVNQTPDVAVMEGDSVNITCCLTVGFERMRVNWRKDQTEIRNVTVTSRSQSQDSLESQKCSTLTFSNITREHSGRYTCRIAVEIPFYLGGEGNGTVITVMVRGSAGDNKDLDEHTDRHKEFIVIVALAVVVALFLITLACFYILRRRGAQAARVIYEVPHIDSEEAEMDKHSTSSSRGSSQWCRVPVYESFDYFEHVQTEESG